MEEQEKKKKNQRERAGEDEGRMRVLERVQRKRKRRGRDRYNVCGGGDSIGKKTKTYGCNEKIEKRNNIKNKKS